MNITLARTIADLAVENPAAITVFERYGIDFCCHGNATLEQACASAGADIELVKRDLTSIPVQQTDPARQWAEESLTSLIQHICDTHHAYTKRELDRLLRLAAKVRGVHGERHPELSEVERIVGQTREDLMPHMLKEEQVLFPYVVSMESAAANQGQAPVPFFGTVQNPIAMMMQEHEAAGQLIAELRNLTRGFSVPDDGCNSYRILYEGLRALEEDLHLHIHLENNILFPRATELEKSMERGEASFTVQHKACACGGH